MKVLQWIFTILTFLYAVSLLATGKFIPFLLALLALALVLPPLQSQINQRLPWLRSSFLKLFLCVVLWFASIMSFGGNVISFSSLNVCTNPTNGLCEQHHIAVLEKTSPLAISAKFVGNDTAEQANIAMDYWAEPGQEEEIYNQTFDLTAGKDQVLLTLDELELQPGNYRIKITPQGIGDQDSLTTDRRFSVWVDPSDVEKRNTGELENVGVKNSVTEVTICENDGETEEPCAEDQQELSSQIQGIAFTAKIPNLQISEARLRGDSEITFLLRYLGVSEDDSIEPDQIFRETSELDREVGTYTLVIPQPEGGFPPGEFELITFLETRASMPVRKLFAIK